jgi:hypothetical protein
MCALTIESHESADALAEVLGAVFDIVEEFSECYGIPVRSVTAVEGFALLDEPTMVCVTSVASGSLMFAP